MNVVITLIISIVVSITALILQRQSHVHLIKTRRALILDADFEKRLLALEVARGQEFDSDAFEDLKTKVEALRIAQGLRGSR